MFSYAGCDKRGPAFFVLTLPYKVYILVDKYIDIIRRHNAKQNAENRKLF